MDGRDWASYIKPSKASEDGYKIKYMDQAVSIIARVTVTQSSLSIYLILIGMSGNLCYTEQSRSEVEWSGVSSNSSLIESSVHVFFHL